MNIVTQLVRMMWRGAVIGGSLSLMGRNCLFGLAIGSVVYIMLTVVFIMVQEGMV